MRSWKRASRWFIRGRYEDMESLRHCEGLLRTDSRTPFQAEACSIRRFLASKRGKRLATKDQSFIALIRGLTCGSGLAFFRPADFFVFLAFFLLAIRASPCLHLKGDTFSASN
jgi:hypothetical protein